MSLVLALCAPEVTLVLATGEFLRQNPMICCLEIRVPLSLF